MKKYFRAIILLGIVLMVSVMLVFADTYHGAKSFTISASQNQSGACHWTPAFNIPSNNLYIKSYANLENPTGITEWYKVKPSSSASVLPKIKIDGTLYRRDSSMAASGGTTYSAYAYKDDYALTLEVTGKIYFYSKNYNQ